MSQKAHTVRTTSALVGGWLLFFVLWTLFLLGWGQGEISILDASIAALTVTGSAAILSPLVWKLTERFEWPGTVTFAFCMTHIIAASIFSIVWTVLAPTISLLLSGESLASLEWDPGIQSWRLMMGVWLYVIVAGLSYTARISSRLRLQQEKAQQAETLAAKANLAAMKNQLQPHFLFNALHSISSLIDTDAERASEAIEKLGDLLRYTIADKESDMLELADEWQFVRDYVDLQKLRF
ncbi:MAG: histidine kinase, partial [Rhodothermales bacterium]|nr:histidine kinase [Rhodothermales bacterium]